MLPGELQTKGVPEITRDGEPVKLMKEAWPGPADGFTAYGRNWANASNTPFREYKHWVHEGGIATPLIVHWPDRIVDGGAFRDTPAHLIDIMATCLDAAGAAYPMKYNGINITPVEGGSLLPVFGAKEMKERVLYWEHEGNRAVRKGKWKLVSKARTVHFLKAPERPPFESWELFDMEIDRTEVHNVAASHPERVREMAEMWLDWAKRTGVIPYPPK